MFIKRNKNIMRLRCLYLVFFVIFSLLVLRLFYLMNYSNEKLTVMTDSQYSYTHNVCDINYKLLDRNNNDLLKYNTEYILEIYPSLFNKNIYSSNQEELQTLNYILKNNYEEINLYDKNVLSTSTLKSFELDKDTFDKLQSIKEIQGMYIYSKDIVDKSEAWKIENILITDEDVSKDIYKDEDSLEGEISRITENNQFPKVIFERDLDGYINKVGDNNLKDNINVKLTIDSNIQDKVRNILQADSHEEVGCILMDTESGDILALAQKNEKLSNVNICANGMGYYPGSIFKIIVEESALENNIINTYDSFYYKGLDLAHSFQGAMSLKEAFIKSNNDVFEQIGYKTGFDMIEAMAKKQGLLDKGLNLYNEFTGTFDGDTEEDIHLNLVSIGQSVRVTPIEAISIANTTANKGIYVKPRLVDSYVDGEGNIISKEETIRNKVVSENTASILMDQMKAVVEEGTGTNAQIDGIDVYGKTGTTEYMELVDGEKQNKSDGWFIGFFNVDGKFYSMVVFVRDIDVEAEGGGSTAAPIFKEIVGTVQ